MGHWGEDIALGAGVETRAARMLPESVSGLSGDVLPATTISPSTLRSMGGDWQSLGYNKAGLAAAGAGNAIVYGGGATLGYKMFGGDAPATDGNGVKNPNYDEARAKFISKFQQEYLGGSKTMSKSKYDIMAKNSSWVKTAVDNMGMENYNKLRQGLMSGQVKAEDAHRMLTNALAESGDEEALKQAGTEHYVLPGIARSRDGKPRFIAMGPMTDSKSKQVKHQSITLKIDELLDDEDEQK